MTKYRTGFLILTGILIAAICFSGNLLAEELDPENPEWLFQEDGNTEGWGSPNALTVIGVEDGVLKMEVIGNDPYIFCGIAIVGVVWADQPPYLDVDAEEHPMLYAGMALSNNNNKVAFYYVTDDDAQWSERQVKH